MRYMFLMVMALMLLYGCQSEVDKCVSASIKDGIKESVARKECMRAQSGGGEVSEIIRRADSGEFEKKADHAMCSKFCELNGQEAEAKGDKRFDLNACIDSCVLEQEAKRKK